MNTVQKILTGLLGLLPKSPFTETIHKLAVQPFWGYVNYFVPISEMLSVMRLWLGSMALYYAWGFVRQWIQKLLK